MKKVVRWAFRGLIAAFAVLGVIFLVLVGNAIWEQRHKKEIVRKAVMKHAVATAAGDPVSTDSDGPIGMSPEDRKRYKELMAKPLTHPFLAKAEVIAMIVRYRQGRCGDFLPSCVTASLHVAREYETGGKLPKDEAQALRWVVDAALLVPNPGEWTRAEQCGYSPVPDPRPAAEIARLYGEGKGVPADPVAAYRWAAWAEYESRWQSDQDLPTWNTSQPAALAETLVQTGSETLARYAGKLTEAQRASAWQGNLAFAPVLPAVPAVQSADVAAVVTPEAIAIAGCADGDEQIIGLGGGRSAPAQSGDEDALAAALYGGPIQAARRELPAAS